MCKGKKLESEALKKHGSIWVLENKDSFLRASSLHKFEV